MDALRLKMRAKVAYDAQQEETKNKEMAWKGLAKGTDIDLDESAVRRDTDKSDTYLTKAMAHATGQVDEMAILRQRIEDAEDEGDRLRGIVTGKEVELKKIGKGKLVELKIRAKAQGLMPMKGAEGKVVEPKKGVKGKTAELKMNVKGKNIEQKEKVKGNVHELKLDVKGRAVKPEKEFKGNVLEPKADVTIDSLKQKTNGKSKAVVPEMNIKGRGVEPKSDAEGTHEDDSKDLSVEELADQIFENYMSAAGITGLSRFMARQNLPLASSLPPVFTPDNEEQYNQLTDAMHAVVSYHPNADSMLDAFLQRGLQPAEKETKPAKRSVVKGKKVLESNWNDQERRGLVARRVGMVDYLRQRQVELEKEMYETYRQERQRRNPFG